ncbi:CesT family type III secretion system chaperone [Phytopseudomonas flavescens]|nr:CesT family type III secretion system chaperone [Pseudomonas flavescens]
MVLMTTPAYRSLIDHFCTLALIPNPASLYERTAIEVNGVDFTLCHRQSQGMGTVLLYADLGQLPSREAAAAALRLLEMNFHLFGEPLSPVFTLNPQSRHINLAAALLLERLSAERLLTLLGELADMAKAWRRDFFLDADQPVCRPGGRPTSRKALTARTSEQ